MLDIRKIREHGDDVRRGLEAKGVDADIVDTILALDEKRRGQVTDVEALKSERNAVSKQIGAMRKSGEDTAGIQAEMRTLGERIAAQEEALRVTDADLRDLLLGTPNTAHDSVPRGATAEDNQVVKTVGEPAQFEFTPRDHVALAEHLDLIDFNRAAKISGAGFALFTGQGALLQRALIRFMLDIHINEHGYRELWPPVLMTPESMTGTGQLPKMADDMYRLADDGLYLTPTAEVPVTNVYRDEIISAPLPVRLAAYSPCFRREAGAAGKDTRGLIRMHQFDKVELVKFVEPETSYEELEALLANAETILQRLELPYRVLSLCGGDLSFAAAKCYDIELWAPGYNGWLEVSSCSNFEDFQARRANIRYRDAGRKTHFVHTLNGSGVALARLFVAILENGQQADGSVILPHALIPYMNGIDRLLPPVSE